MEFCWKCSETEDETKVFAEYVVKTGAETCWKCNETEAETKVGVC